MSHLLAGESPRPAALMRIGLAGILLYDALRHWPFVAELYSSAGLPMPLYPGTLWQPPALPPLWTAALYAVLLFALLAVLLGWQTRFHLAVVFLLFTWFGLLDFAGTFKKYSVIAQHLLILLMFTSCDAVWSVSTGRAGGRGAVPLSPRWPRFLMRVLVSSVYLGAAITKLRLSDFGSGDLLTFSLLDIRWGGGWWGMWLSTHPRLMVFLSMATTLFELAAALLLWVPQCRPAMLFLALAFHLCVGTAMHVEIFTPVMLVVLLAFLTETDLQNIFSRMRFRFLRDSSAARQKNGHAVQTGPVSLCRTDKRTDTSRRERIRVAVRSAGGTLILLACWVTAGVFLQWHQDAGGLYSGQTGSPWQWLPSQTEQAILVGETPQVEDYFHRVEVGRRLGQEQIFGITECFKRGETVFLLARLQQNHPPLRIDAVLIRPDGTEYTRQTRVVERAAVRLPISLKLRRQPTPAGDYTLQLHATELGSAIDPAALRVSAPGLVVVELTLRIRE